MTYPHPHTTHTPRLLPVHFREILPRILTTREHYNSTRMPVGLDERTFKKKKKKNERNFKDECNSCIQKKRFIR